MSIDPFIRTPAVSTNIGTITGDSTGRRVRIMGYVVDQDSGGFVLSDDTGRIRVVTEHPPRLEAFVRVFGSLATTEDGQPLVRAEIIQDLAALDKQLYIKAQKIIDAAASGRSP
ncbi:MAG: hypothetical protein ACFE8F_11490 [Promethearchaeota archaeon]